MNAYNFFSSPIGLGHVTRDIAIVQIILKDISTLILLSGSGAVKILKKFRISKYNGVYNPPSFSVKRWQSLNNQTKWLWNYYQYYKNCKNISEKILQKNNSRFNN